MTKDSVQPSTILPPKDTELRLKFWRGDQVGAERLSATILHIDGFSSVDPQCPLGGPDGLKDARCEKGGWNYIAAVYFPNDKKPFRDVKKKFLGDLKGVAKNRSQGIVFLTNQTLTPGERDLLVGEASKKTHKAIIYHLERLRALLDSPSGYGARLEYLKIEMTSEEQLSFFSHWNRSFSDRLRAESLLIIREVGKKIDALAGLSDQYGSQLKALGQAISHTQSMLVDLSTPSNKRKIVAAGPELSTKRLSLAELLLLHRALLVDAPKGAHVGELRTVRLWLGPPGSALSTANFVPPDPEQVPKLIEDLLSEWQSSFPLLETAHVSEKITAMTKFHHSFVSIHPFTDGNGRIARFLLSQQARELLHHMSDVVIEDRRPYLDALASADSGDYAALEEVVTQAILGVESASN
jgi:fido (protein-threonine AMPylation protein)